MPRANEIMDYRSNPIISSLAAFNLITENKLILRRWDLAIPAYNSGPKHLKKAIKKLSKRRKRSKISLDYILENYQTDHIGFASKNFFSEFIALVHVLAYKDMIYPTKGIQTDGTFSDPENIGVYVSKCPIRPRDFFNSLEKRSQKIREINYHFEKNTHLYPRGTLVVSDIKLSSKKYFRVPNKKLMRKPKHYHKLIKKMACKE